MVVVDRNWGGRLMLAMVLAGGVLVLSGCGSSQRRPAASGAAAGTGGEDIREQLGPFHQERYLPTTKRFAARRERLLKAIDRE
jgi:hypothetical protein